MPFVTFKRKIFLFSIHPPGYLQSSIIIPQWKTRKRNLSPPCKLLQQKPSPPCVLEYIQNLAAFLLLFNCYFGGEEKESCIPFMPGSFTRPLVGCCDHVGIGLGQTAASRVFFLFLSGCFSPPRLQANGPTFSSQLLGFALLQLLRIPACLFLKKKKSDHGCFKGLGLFQFLHWVFAVCNNPFE